MIVVIPCFNEPDLIPSLESLKNCDQPTCDVEVIVVINSGVEHSAEIKSKNLETLTKARNWSKKNSTSKLKYHFIHVDNLPQKHAGVGLARKIGMDEAVGRFDSFNTDGIIICYDADSLCDKNYLTEIENLFTSNSKLKGCSIYFEHPISGNNFDATIYNGIINYELHLRYYVLAMRFCDLPFAYHTIGSSMAVISSAYQKQGGMNKRKAGEDFYFLHKIISQGNFAELKTTRVIPSPRVSDRVPFGTGRAIGEWVRIESKTYSTYNFKSFKLIREFVKQIPDLYKTDFENLRSTVPQENLDVLRKFLTSENFKTAIAEIRKNSPTQETFNKRFFVWFDAFRVLKLVHFLRDNAFKNSSVIDEANKLLQGRGDAYQSNDVRELLIRLREIERN